MNNTKKNTIVIYNNKGGVGKTTSTGYTGWKLADAGYKVLLIDADPQCNLTGMLMDPGFDLIPETQNIPPEEYPQITQDFYKQRPNCNLMVALSPFVDSTKASAHGLVPNKMVMPEVFQLSQRESLLPDGYRLSEKLRTKVPETLYLLPGHWELTDWDTIFTLACESPQNSASNANIISAIPSLLDVVRQEYDYVLIDLSPSANTMNKMFVMNSQFFIIPCSPDSFSVMAVRHLKDMLGEWDDWMRRCYMNCRSVQLPKTKPVFLGYTVQIFTLSNNGVRDRFGAVPAAGFKRWIADIDNIINNELAPALKSRGMTVPESTNHLLARILNFSSTGTAASRAHVPVFALTPVICKVITKSSNCKNMIENADNIFNILCRDVIAKTDQTTADDLQKEYQQALDWYQTHSFGAQTINIMNYVRDNPTRDARRQVINCCVANQNPIVPK